MIRRLRRAVRRSLDLVVLLWGLVVAQPLVPTDHPLGRGDLAPWLTVCLVGVALLRAAPLGAGPHPHLRARRSRLDAGLRRVGLAAIPAALLGAYDAAGALVGGPEWMGSVGGLGGVSAGVASLSVAALLAGVAALGITLGRLDGATAWAAPGGRRPGAYRWFFLVVVSGGLAASAGAIGAIAPAALASTGPALLLGVVMATLGLASGRPVHHAQRSAARRPPRGLLDGAADPIVAFRLALAFFGPTLAFALLVGVGRVWAGVAGFAQAYLVALLVVAWAAVLWPAAPARARLCLLREVVPAGGADAPGDGRARAFDEVPEGALRLDPMYVRPTRRIHPWVIPVRASRVGAADDPVRPLWIPAPPPVAAHVLGRAAALPAPHDHRVDVELHPDEETTRLRGGDVQSRRLVVLRELPALGAPRRAAAGSFAWERAIPAVCRQEVDATTRWIHLEDGDLVVVSSEGVARAFLVEMGEELAHPLAVPRLPQLEDYSPVGAG